MRNSIVIFIPYFGKWPEWIDLFFESVRKNPTIDFLIFTDCDTSVAQLPNVRFREMNFAQYIELVNQKIEVNFQPKNAYKLCDLRPLFGKIHQEDFADYDFYGWCDNDLLFGDIRQFYTDGISGHFALFRNNERNRMMYQNIYNWQAALLHPEFVGIDEHGITNAYKMTFFDKLNEKFNWNIENFITKKLSNSRSKRLYMVEQYTTPFVPKPWLDGTLNSQQPTDWYYKDGTVTNHRDQNRQFIYIHFMNFKSSQWRHDGTKAPWEGKTSICSAQASDMSKGILINPAGIHPL